MSKDQSVECDERTVAVENTSYKWVFNFLGIALLFDVMCRAMFRGEAAWDLMSLVIASGIGGKIYQAHQKTWTRRRVRNAVLVACVSGVIAVAIVVVFAVTRAM